jgi:predicted nucleic acid-binding protein
MLVDAGPLVSFCDPKQASYESCQAILRAESLPLVTTWACFVEAMYIIGRVGGFRLQEHLWYLVQEGAIQMHEHEEQELDTMATMMGRYQNVPMDVADASLISAAITKNDRTIFTLDSHFRIYRLPDGSAVKIVPE